MGTLFWASIDNSQTQSRGSSLQVPPGWGKASPTSREVTKKTAVTSGPWWHLGQQLLWWPGCRVSEGASDTTLMPSRDTGVLGKGLLSRKMPLPLTDPRTESFQFIVGFCVRGSTDKTQGFICFRQAFYPGVTPPDQRNFGRSCRRQMLYTTEYAATCKSFVSFCLREETF